METLTPPVIPALSGRGKEYPTPTSRIGRAWAVAWGILDALPAGEFIGGAELATECVRTVRPHLAPVTMTQLFARMGRSDILVEEKRAVTGTRGVRKRSFYRINPACLQRDQGSAERLADLLGDQS